MSKPPDFDRRRFVGVAAATVAAGPLGLFERINTMTHAVTDIAQPKDGAGTEIRQFSFKASDADLADLRRRINTTKWPEREWVPDSSDGVPLRTMQNLARYWGTEYDWKKCEAKLSALPQFTTEINGLDVRFIHVKSKHPNALPVIVTHGWPARGEAGTSRRGSSRRRSWPSCERGSGHCVSWHERPMKGISRNYGHSSGDIVRGCCPTSTRG